MFKSVVPGLLGLIIYLILGKTAYKDTNVKNYHRDTMRRLGMYTNPDLILHLKNIT